MHIVQIRPTLYSTVCRSFSIHNRTDTERLSVKAQVVVVEDGLNSSEIQVSKELIHLLITCINIIVLHSVDSNQDSEGYVDSGQN